MRSKRRSTHAESELERRGPGGERSLRGGGRQPVLSTRFPPPEHFRESDEHTVCPWKGTASYYDVVVNGDVNRGAAGYYPAPKEAAKNIEGYVAFWRGVEVE